MKNLKKLERDGLLKSKSYGLGEDSAKLWQIYTSKTATSPKRIQDKVLKELGFEVTNWEVHSALHKHDKVVADCFVSLAITNELLSWEGEGNQKSGFRYDAKFEISSVQEPFFLEVEISDKGDKRLLEKIENYVAYYHKTKEPFNVLFTVPHEAFLERLINLFAERKLGSQYMVAVQQEFVADALNAPITTRFDTFNLSNNIPNSIPTE